MSGNKKMNRKKGSEGIKKQTVDIYITDSLSGIMRKGGDPTDRRSPLKIHSHLHLIVLNGYYNFTDLQKKLGPFKIYEENVPKNGQASYRTKAVRNFGQGIYVKVFVNPNNPYKRRCKIEVHQRNTPGKRVCIEFLQRLARNLPELYVSKVEYANDIYCKNPTAVRDLFETMLRHLYIPSQRSFRDNGNQPGVREGKMSRVFWAKNNKIYERGIDGKNSAGCWPRQSLDRVRLEHTAYRRELRKYGIDKIGDLLNSPQFLDRNKGIFQFLHFVKSNKLPRIYDDYVSYISEPNNIGSFLAEHIFYRKQIKGIGGYTADTENFKELTETLIDSWVCYDKEWKDIIYEQTLYKKKRLKRRKNTEMVI